MMAFTHIAFGASSSLAVADLIDAGLYSGTLIFAGGVLGSLLPDIDHPSSAFGKRLLPVSVIIASLFGHRGITHSLIALLGSIVVAWYSFTRLGLGTSFVSPMALGLSIGYLSHLLADWMSNSGIPLFWPSKRRFRAPFAISTGGAADYILAFVLWISTALMALP